MNDRLLTISVGGSRKATRWAATETSWPALRERLRTPIRGKESHAAYMRMTKAQQDQLKDIGGFVGGTLRGGRRQKMNVIGRDLVTLDLDAIAANQTGAVLATVGALGCASCVYSTRKHEPEKPRLRIVIPLDRTVTGEEYEPIARRIGEWLGIEQCDPTTFQSYRLMYWPSASADSASQTALLSSAYSMPRTPATFTLPFSTMNSRFFWPSSLRPSTFNGMSAREGMYSKYLLTSRSCPLVTR